MIDFAASFSPQTSAAMLKKIWEKSEELLTKKNWVMPEHLTQFWIEFQPSTTKIINIAFLEGILGNMLDTNDLGLFDPTKEQIETEDLLDLERELSFLFGFLLLKIFEALENPNSQKYTKACQCFFRNIIALHQLEMIVKSQTQSIKYKDEILNLQLELTSLSDWYHRTCEQVQHTHFTLSCFQDLR